MISGPDPRPLPSVSTTSGGVFDVASDQKRLEAIEQELSRPGAWDKPEALTPLLREKRQLEDEVERLNRLKTAHDDMQAWLELERTELEAMISKSVLPVEIYRYGRPPLLSTRAEIAAGDRMTDLRGETFLVEHTGDLTQILSEKVMSIPPLRGAAAGLYDLRHAVLHEKKTSRFNFDFRLE